MTRSASQRLAAPAAPDATLLARWTRQRDQDAFAALMARHGPMVLGVCRRLLGDAQDAEDVFQAVFLVLSRQASRLRQPEALAGFLHTVAVRLARRACRTRKRRQRMETNAAAPEPIDPRPHPLDVLSGRELLALLDEEMARLPEVYRLPLVLCLLQGRTVEEAARQLGWSIGSLRGRLTRGRERLCRRLARRGLDLSVGATVLMASVVVPEKLLAKSLCQLKGPVPAAISALAGGIMPAWKLKILALTLVLVTAVGLGAGLSFLQTPDPENSALPSPAAPPLAKDEPRRDRFGDPLPEGALPRLGTLRFRVDTEIESLALTPDGKTIAAASRAGIWFVDVASGKRIRQVRTSDESAGGFASRIAFSPDGKRLAGYGRVQIDQQKSKLVLRVWEWRENRKPLDFEVATPVWTGWSEDGQLLAICPGKGEIIVHEMATSRKQHFAAKDLPDVPFVADYRCGADKSILASKGENGAIHVLDLTKGKERHTFPAGGYVFRLALSPDCRWLASLCRDAADKTAVRLWDLTTGKAAQTIATDHKNLFAVAFTPDSKTLATIGTWSEVRFWDVASGRERSRTKNEGRPFVASVAFTPDSRTMIAAEMHSGCLHLWDVATGELKPQPEGHSHWPGPAVFSPDGKLLATASGGEHSILLWDLAKLPGLKRTVALKKPPALKPLEEAEDRLPQPELDDLWGQLAGDARKAYRAIWSLARHPRQSLPLIRARLRPVPRPDAKELQRLIAALDSDDFDERRGRREEIGSAGRCRRSGHAQSPGRQAVPGIAPPSGTAVGQAETALHLAATLADPARPGSAGTRRQR
jgi:RNA polymerase sigma factor (sigma-70 family)